uniref:DNA methyltransferase 1-associated protein 1 n=1 Tax=Syphacia muris TaxID=451379 RepID=A0A0N5A916_9BILA
MNHSDAQDLLGWSHNGSKDEAPLALTDVDKKKRRSRPETTLKRPEGMHRELFSLIGRNQEVELAALIPSSTKDRSYRNPKARFGIQRVRPWIWRPFKNPARSDCLQLCHWERVDRERNDYLFARFNKVISIPVFTDQEYDSCLVSQKWTKDDTFHLFDLCRRYDLRWIIIADRWAGSSRRSIEDMKDRFYTVINELNTLKGVEVEPLCYDAEHEKRRKEQLSKQWDRTKEEIEEEETLILELKKIEIRRRERERKAQDLQKLITASDRMSASTSNIASSVSPGSSVKKKAHRPKAAAVVSHASSNAFLTEHATLRFPEFRSAGAHLRSQEMKLPTNIGQKKLKNIETVIEKLKLGRVLVSYCNFLKYYISVFVLKNMLPIGDEEIVRGYNDFRSSIVLLQELKHTLQNAEYELESLRNKYNSFTGKVSITSKMTLYIMNLYFTLIFCFMRFLTI